MAALLHVFQWIFLYENCCILIQIYRFTTRRVISVMAARGTCPQFYISNHGITVGCHYNATQYNTMLYISLQYKATLKYTNDIPYLTLMGELWVSFVRSLKETDCTLTASHCISQVSLPGFTLQVKYAITQGEPLLRSSNYGHAISMCYNGINNMSLAVCIIKCKIM